MNVNEINAAIAKELGWSNEFPNHTNLWTPPKQNGTSLAPEPLPNFYSSLDACAMFEKTLVPWNEYAIYVDWLADFCKVKTHVANHFHSLTLCECYTIATATASQRCEAFLKTKSLWKE